MQICGHGNVRERLHRIASLSVMPQSFLFSGPRRLGKFLVALEFARALNGSSEEVEYAGEHDILVIGRTDNVSTDASKASALLSVEDIRKAEVFLSRFPIAGRYRILIIDNAERLTISAENALLKLLEEPNSTSLIILITPLPGRLLSTVRSRLFECVFSPVSAEDIRVFFPNIMIPEFFLSLGLPGLIASVANDPANFDEQKKLLQKLFQLSRLKWSERVMLAEALARTPAETLDILEAWIVGLVRQQNKSPSFSIAFAEFIEAAVETTDRIARGEGNPRSLLEKLFTRA
ncbi:MAG: hypothetical protein E6Q06_02945 [Candidatus Moraniibacteriota bacterium]|nr:MAG: hypothetical protein E6Q06_02945 [Candidatus Moranbacteria bacterium]